MKPKTYPISIRITGDMIDKWKSLKDSKVRVAELFKEAGCNAIEQKIIDLKIEKENFICPF